MKPGPKTHWTRARILDAFHAYASTHGRPPKMNEWLKATPFTPSASTIRAKFGTWNHAVEAAGLPSRTTRIYWTHDRLIRAAQAWNDTHGVPPVADSWRVPTLASPSYATVYYHFGSWNALLAAAGLPQVAKRRWTEDQVANAMLDHLIRTGSWPIDAEWKVAANGQARPSHSTVIKLFGSWRAAKRYAGWDPSTGPAVEPRCTECGTDLENVTTGCKRCHDRNRRRTRRAAERVAAPPVETAPLTDSRLDASGDASGAATTPVTAHNSGEADAPAAERRAA